MKVEDVFIKGLKIIIPDIYQDQRGFFCENYNHKKYLAIGINANFVQDNISCSSYGVIRGLHFQKGIHAQSKLVQVISGRVYDVAVDLRQKSKTYGRWFGIELSDTNHRQFFIPRGFAHGFSVLTDRATFLYKCDNFYCPESESGIRFDDPDLEIDWHIAKEKQVVSQKDLNLTSLRLLGLE